MAKRKKSKPLVPHIEGTGRDYEDVVVLRIPAGTPSAEAKKATTWAWNLGKKLSKQREGMWYYQKGW